MTTLPKKSCHKESSRHGSLAEHNNLAKQVQVAVSQTKLAIILPYDCGVARRLEDPNQVFKYGVDGVSDLFGAVMGGRMFCFEIKTGKARQSTEQLNFQKACEKFGIHYEVIRHVDDAIRTIHWLASGDI